MSRARRYWQAVVMVVVWGMSPSSTPDDTGGYGGYGVEGLAFPYYGTGAVGHRDLVLDQSMIMAALDNALRDRPLQRDFASDPVSWAAHAYLSMETMSMAG